MGMCGGFIQRRWCLLLRPRRIWWKKGRNIISLLLPCRHLLHLISTTIVHTLAILCVIVAGWMDLDWIRSWNET